MLEDRLLVAFALIVIVWLDANLYPPAGIKPNSNYNQRTLRRQNSRGVWMFLFVLLGHGLIKRKRHEPSSGIWSEIR